MLEELGNHSNSSCCFLLFSASISAFVLLCRFFCSRNLRLSIWNMHCWVLCNFRKHTKYQRRIYYLATKINAITTAFPNHVAGLCIKFYKIFFKWCKSILNKWINKSVKWKPREKLNVSPPAQHYSEWRCSHVVMGRGDQCLRGRNCGVCGPFSTCPSQRSNRCSPNDER